MTTLIKTHTLENTLARYPTETPPNTACTASHFVCWASGWTLGNLRTSQVFFHSDGGTPSAPAPVSPTGTMFPSGMIAQSLLNQPYKRVSMRTIRRIQIGENDLFKQMRLTSLRDAPYAFSSTYDSALQRSAESWREQVVSTAHGTDRATFIAFADDVPIGIASLYRLEVQPGAGEMLQVWVAPEYRGTNTACDLINAIFKWAGENNFRKIIARVTDGNTRALKFYSRYGFIITDEYSLLDPDSVSLEKGVKG